MNYLKQASVVAQSDPLTPEQVQNSTGAYVWPVDDFVRMERFLIMGSEGGSYYATEQALTKENTAAVARAIASDGERAVQMLVDISVNGRAAKNDPALYVLAMAASAKEDKTRVLALSVLPAVARTGTHLLHFAAFVDGMRGWGRGLRGAIGDWYKSMPMEKAVYQAVKYQQRDGWSHRDLLRLAHDKSSDLDGLYHWIVKGNTSKFNGYSLAHAFEEVKVATTAGEVAALIAEHGLTREMVPTQWLNESVVWEALLQKMPLGALVRNLGKLSSMKLLTPMSETAKFVVSRMADAENVRRSRIHPVGVLSALVTYSSGHGFKGSLAWDAVPQIKDALDDLFYAAFGNVQPTGKNWYLALDVSGSMGGSYTSGNQQLTCRAASAAMAMVAARTEPNYVVYGFQDQLRPLGITAKDTLESAMRKTDISCGATDCSLPFRHAMDAKLPIDMFVVYTDNETGTGYGRAASHPAAALKEYRRKSGINAKSAVVCMVANNFSIADPNDAGMLDVSGFDTAVPGLLSQFCGGAVTTNTKEEE